jgi:hypothetical protein
MIDSQTLSDYRPVPIFDVLSGLAAKILNIWISAVSGNSIQLAGMLPVLILICIFFVESEEPLYPVRPRYLTQ